MINPHLAYYKKNYLFFEIEQRVAAFRKREPSAPLLNLGVGDVALPLAPSIAIAIQKSVQEMTTAEGKHGYGPGCGYPFLRRAIAKTEYGGLDISFEEIFISDGINSDICHLSDLFSKESSVMIPEPAYPLYAAVAAIDGFKKREKASLIYLCSPNNPVGTALSREELTTWVRSAKENKAVILYDGAYASFIRDPHIPKSIYEIPGAKEVAIELRSFSKSAGFTGLRCGYSVVPKELTVDGVPLRPLWELRQETKTNGVAYPIQRGAEASLSGIGRDETRAQIGEYQKSSDMLRAFLKERGQTFLGGENSPYIFWKIPKPVSSWDFFSELLEKAHLITIPGSGFGEAGEGYVRLSTFCTQTEVKKAMERLCVFK